MILFNWLFKQTISEIFVLKLLSNLLNEKDFKRKTFGSMDFQLRNSNICIEYLFTIFYLERFMMSDPWSKTTYLLGRGSKVFCKFLHDSFEYLRTQWCIRKRIPFSILLNSEEQKNSIKYITELVRTSICDTF